MPSKSQLVTAAVTLVIFAGLMRVEATRDLILGN